MDVGKMNPYLLLMGALTGFNFLAKNMNTSKILGIDLPGIPAIQLLSIIGKLHWLRGITLYG